MGSKHFEICVVWTQKIPRHFLFFIRSITSKIYKVYFYSKHSQKINAIYYGSCSSYHKWDCMRQLVMGRKWATECSPLVLFTLSVRNQCLTVNLHQIPSVAWYHRPSRLSKVRLFVGKERENWQTNIHYILLVTKLVYVFNKWTPGKLMGCSIW